LKGGYTRRCGLTRVDFETRKRTPKQSFRGYQELIRQGRVV
jgi:beta-glucosidase/6-phospho-beta-glucosidase/beta-galactosidase